MDIANGTSNARHDVVVTCVMYENENGDEE